MDFDRDFGVNQVFVEDQYERWRDNPAAVDPDWQQYFARLAGLPPPQPVQTSAHVPPATVTNGNGHGNGHALEEPEDDEEREEENVEEDEEPEEQPTLKDEA